MEIVFNGEVSGVGDLLELGNGVTIVMSDYNSDEEAQAAFIGLFKDENGQGVDWSMDTVESFVVAAVPEPSAFAALAGALALGLAVCRRRL